MTTADRFHGVLAPVITPFTERLAIDHDRYASFCRWLLGEGINGLAIFGTTSEANSIGLEERMEATDRLVAAGIDPAVLMPGTGACALADAARLTAHATGLGCGGVLLLPPFYYKNASDDGLFGFVAELIERVGDGRLRIYLYHIPPMAHVGYSLALIGRLVERYPGTVVGLKDSSGDWSNTEAIVRAYPGFDVFPGSESFLLDGLKIGAAGCISATANVQGRAIRAVVDGWRSAEADALAERIKAVRATFQSFPLIAAVKAAVAHYGADEAWARTMPPLRSLGAEQRMDLLGRLAALGYELGYASDTAPRRAAR